MKTLIIFSFILNLAWAQDSAFDQTDNGGLTLQEEAASNNYIHQGKALTQYNEHCFDEEGRQKEECRQDFNRAYTEGIGKKLEAMMPLVTKAYAVVVGAGLGNTFKKQLYDNDGKELYKFKGENEPRVLAEGEDAKELGAKKQKEEKKDYCSYMAIAGEAVSTGFAQMENEKIEQNYQTAKPEAKQAAAFYAIADGQNSAAEASKTQARVWGATAACYGVYLMQPSYRGNKSLYVKLSASLLVTLYFHKKIAAHREQAKLAEDFAKSLPQAGDCNPYTQTSCFCAEETSPNADPVNFQKYCIPEGLVARFGGPGTTPIPCADQNGKLDTACECKRTNTCIDRTLRIAGVDLGLKPITLRDPLSDLAPLANGLSTGSLTGGSRRNLAFAEKVLNANAPSDLGNLNSKQKKDAKSLADFGVPRAAAATLARLGTSTSPGFKAPASLSSSGGLTPGKLAANSPNKNLIKADTRRFKSSGGKRGSRGSKSLLRGRKNRRPKRTNVEIAKFGDKATREAEIRTDDGKGIFEIISYRYQVSAWREFADSIRNSRDAPTTQK